MRIVPLARNARRRALYLVELSGPAGSGKSALVARLREQHTRLFDDINCPRPRLLHRLWATLAACRSLLVPATLSLKERRRLFQGHRRLIAARLWIEELPDGVHLLDEGPFRVMRDYACSTELQMTQWRGIVENEVRRLDGLNVLILIVEANVDQRMERRFRRMGPLELKDPRFNSQLPPREPRQLKFLRDEWDAVISGMIQPPKLGPIDNSGSLERATQELLDRARAMVESVDAYLT